MESEVEVISKIDQIINEVCNEFGYAYMAPMISNVIRQRPEKVARLYKKIKGIVNRPSGRPEGR